MTASPYSTTFLPTIIDAYRDLSTIFVVNNTSYVVFIKICLYNLGFNHAPAVSENIPSLEPSSLSLVTAQAVEELMREGESLNTLASYRSALRYWAAWFGLRYGQGITLPLPANAVLQFIVDHAQRTTTDGLAHELPPAIDQALVDAGSKGKPGPMALNTLIHRIAVLSKAHQLRELKKSLPGPQSPRAAGKTRQGYGKRVRFRTKKMR